MRRVLVSVCSVVLLMSMLSGCVWTEIVVFAEPGILAGATAGMRHANKELDLGFTDAEVERIGVVVGSKLVSELRKQAEGLDSTAEESE